MSKFKLVHEHEQIPFMDDVSSRIKVEFETDDLQHMLTQFEGFIRAAGYFFDGHLQFVESYEEAIKKVLAKPPINKETK